jgi:hypothetical protein
VAAAAASSAMTSTCNIAVLQLPFIVLLEQYRANQPNDGGLIGKDADDIGAPLDLLVEPLER